jgi:hypothetical protein
MPDKAKQIVKKSAMIGAEGRGNLFGEENE